MKLLRLLFRRASAGRQSWEYASVTINGTQNVWRDGKGAVKADTIAELCAELWPRMKQVDSEVSADWCLVVLDYLGRHGWEVYKVLGAQSYFLRRAL